MKYHLIPIEDADEEFILQYFMNAIQFIEEGLEKGAVLVHW